MASMERLVALRKISYGKRAVQPDETFEASERDARLLVDARIAKRADAVGPHPEQPIAAPPPTRPDRERSAPTPTPLPAAADVPAEAPEADAPTETPTPQRPPAKPMTVRTSRGTYRRRDMTAEDE